MAQSLHDANYNTVAMWSASGDTPDDAQQEGGTHHPPTTTAQYGGNPQTLQKMGQRFPVAKRACASMLALWEPPALTLEREACTCAQGHFYQV